MFWARLGLFEAEQLSGNEQLTESWSEGKILFTSLHATPFVFVFHFFRCGGELLLSFTPLFVQCLSGVFKEQFVLHKNATVSAVIVLFPLFLPTIVNLVC